MHQMNFVSDTTKTAHTNIVTSKYVIINRNKYIYDFWMTVFRFSFSVVQLHMEMLVIIYARDVRNVRRTKK